MKITILLVSGLAGAAMLWSQVVGASISGTVRDGSGASLSGAAISVRNIETGAERQLVSDEHGRYSAPSIAVGRYQVSASREGFASQTKTGINLVVGQTTEVDLVLPVGDLQQMVTVEEAP